MWPSLTVINLKAFQDQTKPPLLGGMTKVTAQMLQFTLGRGFKFKCNNRHQETLP